MGITNIGNIRERRRSAAAAPSSPSADRANRELSETSITIWRDTSGGALQTYTTNLTNTYTGGLLTGQTQQNLKNGTDSAAADTYQSYTYQYWDGAIQSGISYDNDTAPASTNTNWTTAYTLDSSGHVTTATIRDGQWRDVALVTDSGRYDVDGMTLYVSNGTALWPGFAIRLGRPSELTRITLRAAA